MMLIGNPVYKRETMVSSRSFRLALVLLIFNGILALVALLNMYSTLAQVRVTAEIQYSSFMDLYLLALKNDLPKGVMSSNAPRSSCLPSFF